MNGKFEIENGILKLYSGDDEIALVPKGVTVIASDAFRNDGSTVREILLPDSVRYLASRALIGCKNLEVLRINKTEITFGRAVFYNVKSGLTIYFAGSSQEWKKAIQPQSESRNSSYDNGWGGGAPGCYWDEYHLYPMGHEDKEKFTCTVHCAEDGVTLEQKGCQCEAFVHHHTPYDD